MVTHMYGGVCNMEKIMSIANKHKIPVLEDCAQCHYGIDNLGRFAGTIGDLGAGVTKTQASYMWRWWSCIN